LENVKLAPILYSDVVFTVKSSKHGKILVGPTDLKSLNEKGFSSSLKSHQFQQVIGLNIPLENTDNYIDVQISAEMNGQKIQCSPTFLTLSPRPDG
jgi:hypothetical protein